MHYQIQMKDNGSWTALGGTYDSDTADERIHQFMMCFNTKKGGGREFRVVQSEAAVKSEAAERFENASRTSRSPK